MVDLPGILATVFGDRSATVRECRRCGATAAADEDVCSNCDAGEIVEYRLDS
ncbi:hypothetical protein [Halostella salina]|uniref:hypothetical protein n=1 Tax=Halostella salina TaxID=1547897 RepID=UPI0013CE4371|nr:hypothetical protein [Halostella salina]